MNARMMRLLKWINRHGEDWQTICGIGKYQSDSMEYMRLHNKLVSMGVEEMTLVLLTHHMYAVRDRIADTLQIFKKYGIKGNEVV